METQITSTVCALETVVGPAPSSQLPTFTAQLVQLMMAGARMPRFWSGEMIPPPDPGGDWKIVQRFSDAEAAGDWQRSGTRQSLLQNFKICFGTQCSIAEQITESTDSDVETAIVTDVRPGMEEAYFEWEAKIQAAQAKYPGYRGIYLQPPAPGRGNQWATLLKFDTPQALETWFASDERRHLLVEAEKLIRKTQIRAVSTSFPGWVPVDEHGHSPPNWKTAMLVLLGLFPVVIIEVRTIIPHLTYFPAPIPTFIGLVGSVAATTFVTMPLFIHIFKWWLYPDEKKPALNFVGTIVLLLLFALEVAIFMFL